MFQYTSMGWVALTGNMTAKTMTLMVVVMVGTVVVVVVVVCVFMLTSLRGDVLAARSRRQLLVL